jgi:hypothetical protein
MTCVQAGSRKKVWEQDERGWACCEVPAVRLGSQSSLIEKSRPLAAQSCCDMLLTDSCVVLLSGDFCRTCGSSGSSLLGSCSCGSSSCRS